MLNKSEKKKLEKQLTKLLTAVMIETFNRCRAQGIDTRKIFSGSHNHYGLNEQSDTLSKKENS
jgi:hypothetical protein